MNFLSILKNKRLLSLVGILLLAYCQARGGQDAKKLLIAFGLASTTKTQSNLETIKVDLLVIGEEKKVTKLSSGVESISFEKVEPGRILVKGSDNRPMSISRTKEAEFYGLIESVINVFSTLATKDSPKLLTTKNYNHSKELPIKMAYDSNSFEIKGELDETILSLSKKDNQIHYTTKFDSGKVQGQTAEKLINVVESGVVAAHILSSIRSTGMKNKNIAKDLTFDSCIVSGCNAIECVVVAVYMVIKLVVTAIDCSGLDGSVGCETGGGSPPPDEPSSPTPDPPSDDCAIVLPLAVKASLACTDKEVIASGVDYSKYKFIRENQPLYIHVVAVNPHETNIEITPLQENSKRYTLQNWFTRYNNPLKSPDPSYSNILAAINGTYFNLSDGKIYGFLKSRDEALLYNPSFRPPRSTFGVTQMNQSEIKRIAGDRNWPEVSNGIGGGPAIISNGEILNISNSISDEDFDPNQLQFTCKYPPCGYPRTAIGIVNQNKVVFVVADGIKGFKNPEKNIGLTIRDLADFMRNELGVENAMLQDGGGSSAMIVPKINGTEHLNKTEITGKIYRLLPSILMIRKNDYSYSTFNASIDSIQNPREAEMAVLQGSLNREGSLIWESNRDGLIGSGSQISTTLSKGPHTIKLTGIANTGASTVSEKTVEVLPKDEIINIVGRDHCGTTSNQYAVPSLSHYKKGYYTLSVTGSVNWGGGYSSSVSIITYNLDESLRGYRIDAFNQSLLYYHSEDGIMAFFFNDNFCRDNSGGLSIRVHRN